MNIKELKKIRPLFTKIVTTAEKFEEDSKVGAIVDTNKLAGTIKPYQKVVAIGANSAGIKEGDIVKLRKDKSYYSNRTRWYVVQRAIRFTSGLMKQLEGHYEVIK